jgi:hypothetical protein
MKKLFLRILCLFPLIIFSNCSSGKYVVSPYGDIANFKLKDGKEYTGEIVFISDTAIFFATKPVNQRELSTLYYFLNQEIKSVEVQGYDGSGWLTSVLFFQVLPAALFVGAAASAEVDNPVAVGFVSLIPALLTSLFLGSSQGEVPQWNDELPLKEITSLKMYSRYPLELNQEEMILLLKRYNQKTIKKI